VTSRAPASSALERLAGIDDPPEILGLGRWQQFSGGDNSIDMRTDDRRQCDSNESNREVTVLKLVRPRRTRIVCRSAGRSRKKSEESRITGMKSTADDADTSEEKTGKLTTGKIPGSRLR